MTPVKVAAPRRNFLIILILGAMTTVSPFSIDMYLPAFPQIATALGSTTAQVSLSLSSYLVGLALGQVVYGPLLDRFGRKRPVYAGLVIYLIATLGCIAADSVEMLISMRLLQAVGGCASSVAAMALVRDLFPAKDTAKIYSLLMLVLSASPLLAPTAGGFVTSAFGWQSVFIILAVIVAGLLAVVAVALPQGRAADPTFSLRPKPIIETFLSILREPAFYTYAFPGAFSFAGLLIYVAISPVVFMEVFHVSAEVYGGIFALLSVGFVGGSQVNILLLRTFSSERIFQTALIVQVLITLVFLVGAINAWWTLNAMVGFFFLYLSSLGLTHPNASALAVAPFEKNIGSASSLIGFLQIGLASLASAIVGLFNASDAVPAIAGLALCSGISLFIFRIAKVRLTAPAEAQV